GVRNPEKEIRGYAYQAKTHTAVAAAVADGRADVGVAVGYVAKLYGLDFIPLAKEHYDLAVRRDRLSKPGVRKMLEALRSAEFAERLKQLPHYEPYEQTGRRIFP
ncbi:MAG: molybdopterin biosynthesis protein, partial [Thaumarchaeota archaeon]|nr:molybdopterin biosynthesis protein [Nitrososphaerota archaeon]